MLLDTWNGFCARPKFLELYADSDVRGPGYEKKGTGNTKQWGWFLGPVHKAGSTTDFYLDEDVVDPDDIETLQDLVIAAVNEAIKTVDKHNAEEMNKVTSGLNVPGMF